ncbi:MAG: hypothetical protein WD734_04360, partial [Dehalococcoidia bacterium]
ADRMPLVARVVLVTAASMAIWLVVLWLGEGAYAGLSDDARHAASAATVFVLTVPLVVLARRYLDRRSWAGLRLTGLREGWRSFVVGVAAWLGPAATLLAILVPLGVVEVEVTAAAPEVAGRLLLLTVLVLVYEAFPEESVEATVGTVIVVEVLPFFESVVKGSVSLIITPSSIR